MSKMSYRTLEFPVSGWLDQVQVGYVENDGSLDEYQDPPGFKLFGHTYDGVLVECICALVDEGNYNRSEGSIYLDDNGAEELFSPILPLPQPRFDWLWATLARCQNNLSKIEVAIRYAHQMSANNSNAQTISILGASFTLCTGNYFKDN